MIMTNNTLGVLTKDMLGTFDFNILWPLNQINKEMKSKTQEILNKKFSDANVEMVQCYPSLKTIFVKIEEENKTESRKLFMRIVKQLHVKASELFCNENPPANVDKMIWEFNHYKYLIDKIHRQEWLAKNPLPYPQAKDGATKEYKIDVWAKVCWANRATENWNNKDV